MSSDVNPLEIEPSLRELYKMGWVLFKRKVFFFILWTLVGLGVMFCYFKALTVFKLPLPVTYSIVYFPLLILFSFVIAGNTQVSHFSFQKEYKTLADVFNEIITKVKPLLSCAFYLALPSLLLFAMVAVSLLTVSDPSINHFENPQALPAEIYYNKLAIIVYAKSFVGFVELFSLLLPITFIFRYMFSFYLKSAMVMMGHDKEEISSTAYLNNFHNMGNYKVFVIMMVVPMFALLNLVFPEVIAFSLMFLLFIYYGVMDHVLYLVMFNKTEAMKLLQPSKKANLTKAVKVQ